MTDRVLHLAITSSPFKPAAVFCARSGKVFNYPDITRSSARRVANLSYSHQIETHAAIHHCTTWLHLRQIL